MRPIFKLLLLALGIPALSCASSSETVPGALQADIDRIVDEAALSGRTIAVSLTDLEESFSYGRNDHEIMHAASTMKVPVMLALMEAVDRGELRFDQPVPIRNEFRSIVDGSEFTLIAGEDGDPDLYDHVGSSAPLEELMRRMIVRSSNLATNLLIELATPARVMNLMSRIGARDIKVLRGVEDEKAYEAGLSNVTTAHDLMLVMKAIAERKAISAAASERMLAILEQQEFRSKIPAGLPPGTRVANKTGTITRISHDAAIVYPPGRRPYVLVVLTRGYDDGSVAASQIAAVSRAVWNHLGNARNR